MKHIRKSIRVSQNEIFQANTRWCSEDSGILTKVSNFWQIWGLKMLLELRIYSLLLPDF